MTDEVPIQRVDSLDIQLTSSLGTTKAGSSSTPQTVSLDKNKISLLDAQLEAPLTEDTAASSAPWKVAVETYLESLQPRERARVTQAHDLQRIQTPAGFLNETVGATLEKSASDSFRNKINDKFGAIVFHIRSFSTVVSIFCQADPTVSLLVWGSVMVVVELASRSIRLFEAVTEKLEQLFHDLDLFERWLNIFTPAKFKELEKSVVEVFVHLIRFLVQSTKFLRRNIFLIVVRILILPNIERDFKQTLAKIKYHTRKVEKELLTAYFETSIQRFNGLQETLAQRNMEEQRREPTLPCYSIRFAQNDKFYGREDILHQIGDCFGTLPQHPPSVPSRQQSFSLYGMGGVGKTQIAIEYAFATKDRFTAILWVQADSEEKMSQDFEEIAKMMGLGGPSSNITGRREALFNWLNSTETPWLLVLDNVDDISLARNFWPKSSHGCVLVTSRDPASAHSLASSGEQVQEFPREKSLEFLLSMFPASITIDDESRDAATELMDQIGHLPLGISQIAGVFLNGKYSLQELRDIYPKSRATLKEAKPIQSDYPYSLSTAWDMSFSSLSSDAFDLMALISLLDSDNIPESLLYQGADDAFLQETTRLRDAIHSLRSRSLVAVNSESRALSVHRLVQEAVKEKLDSDRPALKKAFVTCIQCLSKLCRPGGSRQSRQPNLPSNILIPQTTAVARHFKGSKQVIDSSEARNFAEVLYRTAWCLFERRSINNAQELVLIASSICEQDPKAHDYQLAEMYAFQGLLLDYAWPYAQARSYFERSMQILEAAVAEAVIDANDPLIASTSMDFGSHLNQEERWDESIACHERSIRIREHNPSESPELAVYAQLNLGWTHWRMQQLDLATRTVQEAISKRKELFPDEDHNALRVKTPLMLISLGSRAYSLYLLGNIKLDQHKYEEALSCHTQSLEILVDKFGEFMIICGNNYYKVGWSMAELGKREEAISALRRALAIYEALSRTTDTQGQIARTCYKLAKVLYGEAQYEDESKQLEDRAKAVRREIFMRSPDHPEALRFGNVDSEEAYACVVEFTST